MNEFEKTKSATVGQMVVLTGEGYTMANGPLAFLKGLEEDSDGNLVATLTRVSGAESTRSITKTHTPWTFENLEPGTTLTVVLSGVGFKSIGGFDQEVEAAVQGDNRWAVRTSDGAVYINLYDPNNAFYGKVVKVHEPNKFKVGDPVFVTVPDYYGETGNVHNILTFYKETRVVVRMEDGHFLYFRESGLDLDSGGKTHQEQMRNIIRFGMVDFGFSQGLTRPQIKRGTETALKDYDNMLKGIRDKAYKEGVYAENQRVTGLFGDLVNNEAMISDG